MSTPNYYRIEGLQQFEIVRRRARMCRISMKLMNQPLNLLPFAPIHHRLPVANGISLGMQEVPVAQIVGSVGRWGDYDRRFRPLHDNQRDRWVNMWVRHSLSGWDSIAVRKVGNLYFVEDGHHRTSVARAARLSGINANVTEYPLSLNIDTNATLERILAFLEELATTDIVPASRLEQRTHLQSAIGTRKADGQRFPPAGPNSWSRRYR